MSNDSADFLRMPSLASVDVLIEKTKATRDRLRGLHAEIQNITGEGPEHSSHGMQVFNQCLTGIQDLRILILERKHESGTAEANAAYGKVVDIVFKFEYEVDGFWTKWSLLKRDLFNSYRPPVLSEIITRLFSNSRQVDRIIDSRSEIYVRNCCKYGVLRARISHWTDTIRSCWPAVQKLIPFGLIIEVCRRIFGN